MLSLKIDKLRNLARRIEELPTRKTDSLWNDVAEILGESAETMREAADTIEAEDYARRNMLLESLVRDWYELYEDPDYGGYCRLTYRMRELGIEVDDE